MQKRVLVTGASGYIGGRLVPELLKNGHEVHCLVRTPEKLDGQTWRSDVTVHKGDIGNAESLKSAMDGLDCAYYLVHAMGDNTSSGFAKRDKQLAATFRDAASEAGLEQVVYLGGLGDDSDPNLSPHLRSRHEVGVELAKGAVPVTELRAAVIIGSGSASFEMLRHVVEVLPAMITPKWVKTRCQPIAIRDVLHYLVQAIVTPEAKGQTIEIGGPDVVTYETMMSTYAEVVDIKPRKIIGVPFLTPKLSSHWIGLVTPLPTSVAKPLVGGLASEVVVNDSTANDLLPHNRLTLRQAIELAVERTRDLEVSTSWAGADLSWRSPAHPMPTDPDWSGGTVLDDTQTVTTDRTPEEVFASICSIGGDRGWLITDYLWAARGWIDALVGGVGMRRGRRHPTELRVGDPVDFWRVEALVPNRLLRLRAEMRLPGRAWLEWTINENDANGQTQLTQRARYQPRGVLGRLYWYSLLPFHAVIFKGLAKALVSSTYEQPRGDSQHSRVP